MNGAKSKYGANPNCSENCPFCTINWNKRVKDWLQHNQMCDVERSLSTVAKTIDHGCCSTDAWEHYTTGHGNGIGRIHVHQRKTIQGQHGHRRNHNLINKFLFALSIRYIFAIFHKLYYKQYLRRYSGLASLIFHDRVKSSNYSLQDTSSRKKTAFNTVPAALTAWRRFSIRIKKHYFPFKSKITPKDVAAFKDMEDNNYASHSPSRSTLSIPPLPQLAERNESETGILCHKLHNNDKSDVSETHTKRKQIICPNINHVKFDDVIANASIKKR